MPEWIKKKCLLQTYLIVNLELIELSFCLLLISPFIPTKPTWFYGAFDNVVQLIHCLGWKKDMYCEVKHFTDVVSRLHVWFIICQIVFFGYSFLWRFNVVLPHMLTAVQKRVSVAQDLNHSLPRVQTKLLIVRTLNLQR